MMSIVLVFVVLFLLTASLESKWLNFDRSFYGVVRTCRLTFPPCFCVDVLCTMME